MRLCCDERGQSEVVGVILLIAVVVTLVIGAGAVIFTDWQSETERNTQVNIDSDLTATQLTLKHMGGDSLEPEDVLFVLQRADIERTLDDTGVRGSADRFEPGSVWEYELSEPIEGEITLSVFDTSTNTELHRATYEVGTTGLIVEVDGQRGTATVEKDSTVPYTVIRTFERGSQETVTDEATVSVDGESIDIDPEDGSVTAVETGTSVLEAELETENATIDVSVVTFPNVTVDSFEDIEVTEGEPVVVETTVENTGTAEATQSIDAEIVVDDGGETVFSETTGLTLDPGDEETVEFEWQTTEGDADSYTVTVRSEDDTQSAAVTVTENEPRPSDLLEIREDETLVGEGEAFETYLTWTNVHNETVTLITTGEGTEPSRTTVEIEPGEEVTPKTLGFPEEGVLVSVDDDTDETEVLVEIDENE